MLWPHCYFTYSTETRGTDCWALLVVFVLTNCLLHVVVMSVYLYFFNTFFSVLPFLLPLIITSICILFFFCKPFCQALCLMLPFVCMKNTAGTWSWYDTCDNKLRGKNKRKYPNDLQIFLCKFTSLVQCICTCQKPGATFHVLLIFWLSCKKSWWTSLSSVQTTLPAEKC